MLTKIAKPIFYGLALFALFVGIIGILRQRDRAKIPFDWEETETGIKVETDTTLWQGDSQEQRSSLILIEIDGFRVQNELQVMFSMIKYQAGQTVPVKWKRDGLISEGSLKLESKYSSAFIILNAILGCLFWLSGFFVYLKKSDDRAARVFGWGCLCISTSIMLFWEGALYKTHILGSFPVIVYFFVYPLIPALILHFSLVLPSEQPIVNVRKWLITTLYIPSLVFIVLLEYLYLSALQTDQYFLYLRFWKIYSAFRVIFVIYSVLMIISFLVAYKNAVTKQIRNKIQWIFLGIVFGMGPFILLWTLPQVLGFQPLVPEEVNYLFLMIFPLSFAFSIIKYQILDIEIILNRSIVYSLVSGIIVSAYLVIVGIAGYGLHIIGPNPTHILTILFTLIAVALFSPLKKVVQSFVDTTFYRQKYNYRKVIQEFGKSITAASDQEDLSDRIIKSVDNAIPVSRIALIVFDTEKRQVMIEASQGLNQQEIDTILNMVNESLNDFLAVPKYPFMMCQRHQGDSSKTEVVVQLLELNKMALCIPAVIQDTVEGMLIMGNKLSGVRFSEEDLELLVPMVEEGFTALERLRFQVKIIVEREQKRQLEAVSNLKSEFIAHVSHELRTPMTSISWAIANLIDGIPEKPSMKVRTYLEGIQDSTNHLNQMIQNLLDITRIEAGKIEIRSQTLLLKQEIDQCIEIVGPLIKQKNIHLVRELDDALLVTADADWLHAILINLLDNAVKFSDPDGQIIIKACDGSNVINKGSDSNFKKYAVVSVQDNGPGIPANMLTRIFRRFERIHSDQKEMKKGLGLGLPIVKKLVGLQGGKIWIESDLGKGSIFYFTLYKEKDCGRR
ncbi:hypothetical protein BVY01_00355 [bacterium I07]|nr:hypothetical protein BVY01_00355 [bacterium I07]